MAATKKTRSTAATRKSGRTRRTAETTATATTRATADSATEAGSVGATGGAVPGGATPEGDRIVALALRHLNEQYILGARAPMADDGWRGPWDCAEFASWCVFQASGILYGVQPRHDPILADAFTGFWGEQARADGAMITPEAAARIPGACVLRLPSAARTGHIVISDGLGGTIEAHSSKKGVIRHTLSNRRWDAGILVPGVDYFMAETPVTLAPPAELLRVTRPLMRGTRIEALQRELTRRGYHPGTVDGIYGPQTASAVQAFQADSSLVPDGEAGSETMGKLGIA